MFCKAFNKSLVVEPGKTLAVCCSDGKRMLKSSLADITSLTDFFYNSKRYNEIREEVKNLTSPTQYDNCLSCQRADQGYDTEMKVMNEIKFPAWKGYDNLVDLKFLEVTTSNICKQSCVMRGSKYSSTHAKLEGNLEHISFMDEREMKMIYQVLPEIDYICLKGGEPFADQNNLKILTKLYECNPNIKEIVIVSNGQNISLPFIRALTKFTPQQLTLGFSLDGVDELYNWQRGSEYSKTVDTLNQLTRDTGLVYSILNTVTVYSLPSLLDTFEMHCSDLRGVNHVTSSNIVWTPAYTSCALYTQSQIDDIVGPIMEFKDTPEVTWNRNGVDKIKSFGNNDLVGAFSRHTEKWNNIRKLNIYDHVPELSWIGK